MLRALPLALVVLLLAAAGAQAATLKIAAPAEGQVAVAVASVPKQAKLKASAPAGVAVAGAVKKGRLAVAVIRPRGAGAGEVKLTIKGGKAKRVKRYAAALGGDSAPASVCKGPAPTKALVAAGLSASELRTVGQAAAARLCGKPLPAAAPAVLAKLGLGSAPQGGLDTPGDGKPSILNPPKPPPPDDGSTNECSNGIDDDGDGQADAPSERRPRPDPGCMNANDRSENSEVPLTCNAGAGVAEDDQALLQIGIDDDCGEFVEVAVYAAPSAFVCDIQASAGNWVCVIAHGHAYADTRNAIDAGHADLQIGLNGPADCAVPATIVLTRRNFEVAELVTPIARCGDDWWRSPQGGSVRLR
jgi:hypothetical protein